MQRSRFFMLLLVCMAVLILCAPGAAAAHDSPSGGGSESGGAAGAASSASSGPSGFSSSAPSASFGTTVSSAGEEAAQTAELEWGAEPGISEYGAAAGDPGSSQAGQEEQGRSPDNDQGPESQQDSGSGDGSTQGPRFTEQDEPSRNPKAGIPGDQHSGYMGADAPGETAGRVLKEGSGFQGGDGIRSPAGIIVFGAAGGMARGSDLMTSPPPGDGGAGRSSRNGAPEHPWHSSRETEQRSVPPETAARIEQGSSESPSRARAKREEESGGGQEDCCRVPAAHAPDSVPGSALFFLFSLFGFRRIQKKTVLDNDSRRAVFQAIGDAPGIDAVSLSEQLEMNINTLRYHLAKLLATDKITYLSRPGTVRYYLNQGRYSPFEQLVLHYLRAATAGSIIQLVSERPGISRQDLATAVGISGPSVTRHMQQLSSEGIIRNEPDGRANHYHLTEETALLLKKFQVIRTGISVRVSPAAV